MYNNIKYLIALFFITLSATSQEGIAVYSDYLSDNYLIHPSMAGAANCAKLRVTGESSGLVRKMRQSCKLRVLTGELEKTGAGLLYLMIKWYHSQE
jgi:hypothetical protein